MPSNIDFLHGSVLGVSSLTVGGAFRKLILELRIQLSFQVHLEELDRLQYNMLFQKVPELLE